MPRFEQLDKPYFEKQIKKLCPTCTVLHYNAQNEDAAKQQQQAVAALAAGAKKTGTTIHWVDAGVDTGEIIAQAELDIAPDDNEESLHERIKILERSLIVATIEQLLSTMENGRS